MLGGSCGLQVRAFHGHKNNHEKQHVRVDYVCTNAHHGKNMTVLDDAYYTVYGMLCDLCKFTLFKIKPFFIIVFWIFVDQFILRHTVLSLVTSQHS